MEVANERLGDFQIVGELGRGGMGVVYEAEQLSIGRRVALKVLPFATLADPRALARFKNEVRAAAALDHPHIVTVHSVGEERGIHYFSMQLIRGQSLAEVIHELLKLRDGNSPGNKTEVDPELGLSNASRTGQTTHTFATASTSVPSTSGEVFYRRVAELGIEAADALHFAHEQGVVHRDIKPANLMLDAAGKLYVTDFGLARIQSDAGVTMTGDLIGTLRYMAPEQALAKRIVVDHRADVYSLGTTLYEFATLQPVFLGTNRERLLRQVAFEQPVAPSKIARDIPGDLETIICKAISKDPEDRYATSAEFADDLRRFLDHRTILARRPSQLQIAMKWTRRNPAIFVTTLVTLAVVAIVLAIGFARVSAESEKRRREAYPTALSAAYREFAHGQYDTVGKLLNQTEPTGRQSDLRGFEWHLLNNLGRQFEKSPFAFNGRVREVAYGPNGRWFAALTIDGELSIVDPRRERAVPIILSPGTRELASRLGDEEYRFASSLIAFSPDGRYLYSAAVRPGPLLRYDLLADTVEPEPFSDDDIQPKCTHVAVANNGTVATMGRSKDGKPLVVVWNAITRQAQASASIGSPLYCSFLKLSPAGDLIAIGGTWFPITVCTTDDLSTVYQDYSNTFAGDFSPDGKWLAFGAHDQTVVLDVSKMPLEEVFKSESLGDDRVYSLKFVNQTSYVAGTKTGIISLRSAATDIEQQRWKHRLPVRAISYSPSRQELAIGGVPHVEVMRSFGRRGTAPVWSMYPPTIGVGTKAAAFVTLEDADLIMWFPRTNETKTVCNFARDYEGQYPDVWTNIEKTRSQITDISLSHDETKILVQCSSHATLWNEDGGMISEWATGSKVLTLSADAKRVAAYNHDEGAMVLWDPETATQICSSGGHQNLEATAIEFSTSGKYVVTGHGLESIPVWFVFGSCRTTKWNCLVPSTRSTTWKT